MATCSYIGTFDWTLVNKWQSVRTSYEETEEKRREEMSENSETATRFIYVILNKETGESVEGPHVFTAPDKDTASMIVGTKLADFEQDLDKRKMLDVAVRPF